VDLATSLPSTASTSARRTTAQRRRAPRVDRRTPWRGSLAWRAFITNAAILALVAAGLILTPLTVSHPVAAAEAAILVGGLALMLLVNLALVRRTFAPLAQLTRLMGSVDLLRPGSRVGVDGATDDVRALASAFNAMLERLENERRESTRRAVVAQEAERLRIGRELHDDLGQTLTGVLLQLDQAVRAHPGEPELEETREAARDSLDLVRRLARDLRPDALDDLGLISGLIALCSRFARQTSTEIEHDLPTDLPAMPRELDVVLYRVTQEALTNVVRHADATRACVRLSHHGDSLTLTVEDDGRGLAAGTMEGTGIRGMRERAMLARGRLAIGPRSGGGTQVILQIPVDQHE
jgi:two-component system sensor histidine kinase UhpB